VAEAQTAVQPDAAPAGADLKRLVVLEEAPRAVTEQTKEEGPTSRVVEAHESSGARVPLVAEAGSKAEAPGTSEAEMVETSAAAWDSEMEVEHPLVTPLDQGLPPSQESAREVGVQATSPADTSRGKEAADVEADSTAEQPVLAPGEGNSALARV